MAAGAALLVIRTMRVGVSLLYAGACANSSTVRAFRYCGTGTYVARRSGRNENRATPNVEVLLKFPERDT